VIRVKCVGHIGTSLGTKEVEINDETIDAEEIVDRLRALSKEPDPGFTRYNTLVMVDDGDAFVPAGDNRVVRSGQSVILIPFSHGG